MSLNRVKGKSKYWRCKKCNAILEKKYDPNINLDVSEVTGYVSCGHCGESYNRDFVYTVGLYDLYEVEGTCPRCGQALRGPGIELLDKPCPACGKLINKWGF